MSTTFTGSLSVSAPGGSKMTGMFSNGGPQINFGGNLSVSIQPFTSTDATFTGSPIGTHTYEGTIGPNRFSLKFDNGGTMTGSITPTIETATVTGSGSWLVRDVGPTEA